MAVIEKAIIPAAGRGTRFLPQTKASPKEMMPLVDRPIIQRVVEELVDAGVKTIVIVTGANKRAIEDHFDTDGELEEILSRARKENELSCVRRISDLAEFIYIRQKGPAGNATPILNSRPVMDGPFYVFWGDDFVDAVPSRTRQLLTAFEKYQSVVLGGIINRTEDGYKKYAFVEGEEIEDGVIKVFGIVEKPGTRISANDLAIVSGFIATPEIFPHLENAKENLEDGQELVYTAGIQGMINSGKPVYALRLKNAKYWDTGSKLGYMQAVVDYALKHPEIGEEFGRYLRIRLNLT